MTEDRITLFIKSNEMELDSSSLMAIKKETTWDALETIIETYTNDTAARLIERTILKSLPFKRSLEKSLRLAETGTKFIVQARSTAGAWSLEFAQLLVHFGNSNFPGIVTPVLAANFRTRYRELVRNELYSTQKKECGSYDQESENIMIGQIKSFVRHRVNTHNKAMWARYRGLLLDSTPDLDSTSDLHELTALSSSSSAPPPFSFSERDPDDGEGLFVEIPAVESPSSISEEGLKELNGIVRVEGERYPIQYDRGILADGKLSVLQEHTKKNVEFWTTYFRKEESAFLGKKKGITEDKIYGLVLGQYCLPHGTKAFFGGVLRKMSNLSEVDTEYAMQLDEDWAIVPDQRCDLWGFANCAQRADKTVANHLNLQRTRPLSGNFVRSAHAQEEIFLSYGRRIVSAAQSDDFPVEDEYAFVRAKSRRIASIGLATTGQKTTAVIVGPASSKRKKEQPSRHGEASAKISEDEEKTGNTSSAISLSLVSALSQTNPQSNDPHSFLSTRPYEQSNGALFFFQHPKCLTLCLRFSINLSSRSSARKWARNLFGLARALRSDQFGLFLTVDTRP